MVRNNTNDETKNESTRNERRREFWDELGIPIPDYEPEDQMPPVDEDQIRRLEAGILPLEEKRLVYEYILKYQPWADAHARILLEDDKS